MAASKLNANWSGMLFNSVMYARIDSANFDYGASLAPFSSGVDRFPTQIALLMSNPKASFTSADVGAVMAITPGTTSTLVGTLKDAFNQSGGDVIFTMSNSVSQSPNASGNHASYATATCDFLAFSSDGSTPPLAVTRA